LFFRKSHKATESSDLELIERYRSSADSKYIGELFQRYSHLVFGTCMKYLKNEAESRDAVMNIFEKLNDDLRKHTITNFKSWIHTVSRNHCLMQLRSRKHTVQVTEESGEEIMESAFVLHPNEDNKEIELSRLEGCIEKLVNEQKHCVELFYLQEKSYKEIVETTHYTINEVKSFIQNGKRNLKNCMSGVNE